jgi:uroporphyrinogen-III decarboxylase
MNANTGWEQKALDFIAAHRREEPGRYRYAATGADALNMECSMKGFVNDLGEAARRIGDRMTLFSNIDPVAVLQNGTDADLEKEIRRQVAAGRAARGFILSTASPITPSTPLARVAVPGVRAGDGVI